MSFAKSPRVNCYVPSVARLYKKSVARALPGGVVSRNHSCTKTPDGSGSAATPVFYSPEYPYQQALSDGTVKNPLLTVSTRSVDVETISSLLCTEGLQDQAFRASSGTQTEPSFGLRPLVTVWPVTRGRESEFAIDAPDTPEPVLSCKDVDFLAAKAQSEEPSSQNDPDAPDENFFANAGDAIRTLRREFPRLFHEELTYSIYREDIVFRDPRNTFHGLDKYKLIFKTLRFFGNTFFRPESLRVDIIRIWQPTMYTIRLRWTIRGLPRLFWPAGTFDGNSEFKLDRQGKIYEHKVDNIAMNDDSFKPVLSLLNLSLSRKATPATFASAGACTAVEVEGPRVKRSTLERAFQTSAGAELDSDREAQPSASRSLAMDLTSHGLQQAS